MKSARAVACRTWASIRSSWKVQDAEGIREPLAQALLFLFQGWSARDYEALGDAKPLQAAPTVTSAVCTSVSTARSKRLRR